MKRIKNNLLANGRNSDPDKVKEICSAWWEKCKYHQKKTDTAWEMCFDRAEDRKQGLIKVYDFTLELEAWNAPKEDSRGREEIVYDGQRLATPEFQEYINLVARYARVGQKPPFPSDNLHEEYRDIFRYGEPAVKKWWQENVGMV